MAMVCMQRARLWRWLTSHHEWLYLIQCLKLCFTQQSWYLIIFDTIKYDHFVTWNTVLNTESNIVIRAGMALNRHIFDHMYTYKHLTLLHIRAQGNNPSLWFLECMGLYMHTSLIYSSYCAGSWRRGTQDYGSHSLPESSTWLQPPHQALSVWSRFWLR